MPITLAPPRENGRGKGAIVTVEARPYLTRTLLPDTVRRVVLSGTREQLRPVVLASFHGTPAVAGGGAVPILSPSDIEALFGRDDLKALCETAKGQLGQDIEREPHRAEIRVSEWLDRELAAVYPLTAGESGQVAAAGQSGGVAVARPDLGELVARRQFRDLARFRETITPDRHVVRAGVEELKIGGTDFDAGERVERMMVFALRVQAAAVDRMIREDIRTVAADIGRNRLTPELVERLGEMTFSGLDPSEDARRLFTEYVSSKWRIRVFAIEPVLEQQNVADFLSRRSIKHVDVAGARLAQAAGPPARRSPAGRSRTSMPRRSGSTRRWSASGRVRAPSVGGSTPAWRYQPRTI